MEFRNDTDSTEKILKLIRNKNESENDNAQNLKAVSQHKTPKKSFSLKQLFYRKKYTIGFDFKKDSVNIVKLALTSDHKHRLISCKIIYFNQNHIDNEDKFEKLKSYITYEYNTSKIKLWAAIPKGKAEVRYLKIPKVPKKQLSKSIFWTFKKNTSIDEKNYILDYEILGEVKDKGTTKIEVVAYAVLKKDIEYISSIFSKIEFPISGVSLYPFALQNLVKYKYIDSKNENICCIYIGTEWSRIDIFLPNGTLAFSRRIKACTNSMIDEISRNINQLQSSINGIDDFSKQHSEMSIVNRDYINPGQIRKIFFGLINNLPDLKSNIDKLSLNINQKDLFGMFVPALKRLVWQVARSIEYFQANASEKHIGKIYVSGRVVDYKPILDFIGNNLEHKIEARDFDPFSSDILNTDSIELPGSNAEKSGYVPAFGIALSKNFFTPNFMFTYKEKKVFLNSKRTNIFLIIFIITLIIFTISGFWLQRGLIKKKDSEIAKLQNIYNKIILKNNIYIENKNINEQILKIQNKREGAKLFAKRNLGIAAIGEVLNSTPRNIRLFSISFNTKKEKINNKKKSSAKEENEIISIDVAGLVQGNSKLFETSLLNYIDNLKNNPVFDKSTIKKKEKQVFNNEPSLNFHLNIELKRDD